MAKLWQGKFHSELSKAADDFNSSIAVDSTMWKEDVLGSIAHAEMLGLQGIITSDEANLITFGLKEIYTEIENGKIGIDLSQEDIHTFIETLLTEKIGKTGGKLHTARSRNDQVATDTKLYVRKKTGEVQKSLIKMLSSIYRLAKENKEVIMPGYTHLQRAQPILFSHNLLAYAEMFKRDYIRLENAKKNLNYCPLGSGALSGTTYPIDRQVVSEKLGFISPTANSIDGVSDRDYAVEIESALAIIAMHLSRLSEEIILWNSFEFSFISIGDEFTTGSSIMPQKKNPDIAELARGKCGRVYGNLTALLVTLKGLPLAYNKDMQEDKEGLFDSLDTVIATLNVFAEMLATVKAKAGNMLKACEKGFINATDLADYLAKSGMPFREAYKTVGDVVAFASESGINLSEIPLEKYKEFSPVFEKDLYEAIDFTTCVNLRNSFGGTSKKSVEYQLEKLEEFISNTEKRDG